MTLRIPELTPSRLIIGLGSLLGLTAIAGDYLLSGGNILNTLASGFGDSDDSDPLDGLPINNTSYTVIGQNGTILSEGPTELTDEQKALLNQNEGFTIIRDGVTDHISVFTIHVDDLDDYRIENFPVADPMPTQPGTSINEVEPLVIMGTIDSTKELQTYIDVANIPAPNSLYLSDEDALLHLIGRAKPTDENMAAYLDSQLEAWIHFERGTRLTPEKSEQAIEAGHMGLQAAEVLQSIHIDKEHMLNPYVENLTYGVTPRVVSEALWHGNATPISVFVEYNPDILTLPVDRSTNRLPFTEEVARHPSVTSITSIVIEDITTALSTPNNPFRV